MVEIARDKETVVPYRELVKSETANLRIWDYLAYDREGELLLNGLKVTDLAKTLGTPLEIVETTVSEKRARQWIELTRGIAAKVGYTGGIEYFYATKANPASEIAASALRAGWNLETSSQLDLMNIAWMFENGLTPEGLKIVCNGLKLHPSYYNVPDLHPKAPEGVIFDGDVDHAARVYESSYAELIALLRGKGMDITPIIDSVSELDYFAQPGEIPEMEVGVRLKVYGPARNDGELTHLKSRHGMDWDTIIHAAERIDKCPHLTLTTFHSMIGAAETIPVDTLVQSLLFTSEKYFELKRRYPTLNYFNMGGGVPPLGANWDHQGFVEKLLVGLKQKAQERGLEQPVMVFEFGSFIAAESGIHVMKVLHSKKNSVEDDGRVLPWAIVDLPFMRAIPDMLMVDKHDFTILAANNANSPTIKARLGDLTCDSDGVWPPKKSPQKFIHIPDTEEDLFLVIVASGAYGETLTGIGGVGHCGLLEPAEAIIEKRRGNKYVRVVPRQSIKRARELLGYNSHSLEALRESLKS